MIAVSPNLNKLSKIHYVVQEDPSSTFDKKDLYPVLCDDGEQPFILKIANDGEQITTIPLTPDNFNLKNLKPLTLKHIRPTNQNAIL